MFVMSRRANESIVIDNSITIFVVEVRGERVRLGIEAPRDVSVHRREVYDAIRRASEPAPLPAPPRLPVCG